jgi:hypothetical protein
MSFSKGVVMSIESYKNLVNNKQQLKKWREQAIELHTLNLGDIFCSITGKDYKLVGKEKFAIWATPIGGQEPVPFCRSTLVHPSKENKPNFLACLFNDLDNISEGTNEEVQQELEGEGINIEKAKEKFFKLLKIMNNEY